VEQNREALVLADDARLAHMKEQKKRVKLLREDDGQEGDSDDEEDHYEEEDDEEKEETIPDSQANTKMSWKVADAYTLLAASYKRAVEFDRALEHYLAARDMYRCLAQLQPVVKGGRGEKFAKSTLLKIEKELATVYIVLEAYDKSAEHLKSVLQGQIESTSGGRFDPQVALTEHRLGDVYTLARKPADARHHFENAVLLYTSLYGAKHKTVEKARKRMQVCPCVCLCVCVCPRVFVCMCGFEVPQHHAPNNIDFIQSTSHDRR
jgi:tetratricopeptide (TPR) repeat protein